jgi:hypothetical protein
MPIASQRSILGIAQALFDAAPGAHFFYSFSQAVAQGTSLPLLVTSLIATTAFNATYTYSPTLPTAEFAEHFTNDLLGDRVSQADKNTVVTFITGQTAAGMSRDDVMSAIFGILAGMADENQTWGTAAAFYKQEVVTKILDNLLGNSPGIADIKEYLLQQITDAAANDGAALGELIVFYVSALDAIPEYDPLYGEVAHRFHNKLETSEYYSLNLALSGASLADLQSVIAPVTADDTTVLLARMKADYFAAHPPWLSDCMVVSTACDISTIDVSPYKCLIIDPGAESLPLATATMTAAQAAAFSSITKGAGGRLAVVDTIAGINAHTGWLESADSIIGVVTKTVDLTTTNLATVIELKIDDGTSDAIVATVTAAQATALFGNLSKGSGDKLAVMDSVATISAAPTLAHADQVTGLVSTTSDLSTANLTRLTDLTIGTGSGASISVSMSAAQAEKLAGHIVKGAGASLTLFCVPSEISTLPALTDAFVCTVPITRDLRLLDLAKCVSLIINDGTSTSITATLLAAQAQDLAGQVTKGMSDRLVVDDTPANILATTDLSAADVIYATDLSGNDVTVTESELGRFTLLRTAGKTTLNNATSTGLPQDAAKIAVTGGGTLLVTAAPGNFTVALSTMAGIAQLTAQPDTSITLTDATNAGLPSTIQRLKVSGSGLIQVIGATGENLVISESGLASVGSLVAAPNASIALADATGTALAADLQKLKVSGTGRISITGSLDEHFTVTEATLLPLKTLTAQGSGTIAVTNVYNANLATILGVTTIAGTGSVSITGATGEALTISSLLMASEPIMSVTAASDQSLTLAEASAATLAADTAKLHVSGVGKINIAGATGQNLTFSETALSSFGTVSATGSGNISITDVTAATFASDLSAISVANGTISMLLATGQALSVTHAQLSGPLSITAASGENLWLTGATGSTLVSDLSKLHVSGGGLVDVTGASNENLSLSAAGMASISTVHATGTGDIFITDSAAASVETLLDKVSISGTGAASVTFTDAQNASVSAAAANTRKIIASDTNGSISITNAPGKQTFYASPGSTGSAQIITQIGDSAGNTSTCDILNVLNSGTTMLGLSAISADDAQWNVTTSGKATTLGGAGVGLDPLKYDAYIASVSSVDYVVYETAVNGSSFEAIKIIGTVSPAVLQMYSGILYLS